MGYVRVGIRKPKKRTLLLFVTGSAECRERLLAKLNDLSRRNVVHPDTEVDVLPNHVVLMALPPNTEMELLVQTILAELIGLGFERRTLPLEDFKEFDRVLRSKRRGAARA